MICSNVSFVLGMALNCIHIFIVTGSFLYWFVMRPASQRFFIHSCIYLRILIISYLATFLGTSLITFLCWCAVKQSINQPLSRHVGLAKCGAAVIWILCTDVSIGLCVTWRAGAPAVIGYKRNMQCVHGDRLLLDSSIYCILKYAQLKVQYTIVPAALFMKSLL